jgi:hypothetical protein
MRRNYLVGLVDHSGSTDKVVHSPSFQMLKVDMPPTFAVRVALQQPGEGHEKWKAAYLDASRCANPEVTGAQENSSWEDREDA